MAIEVGTAYLSILPSTAGLAAAIRKELAGVENSTGPAGEKAGRSFASRFASSAGSMIAGAMKTGAFAAVIGGGFLAGAGLKTAADLEQAKIGFETMLGSASKAETMMKQIQDTAANTPFELEGLTQSAEQMLAFGFAAKDVIPTLTTLGDAAAGLGRGQEGLEQISLAVGQIQAKGKVQSDELLQLTEAGIPALKILANQYGVTSAQMQEDVTAGIVTADKAIPALLSGIKNGSKGLAGETTKFGGLMAKQSQSLSGLFSTVKDTLLVGMAQQIEPLIPKIKTGLAGAIKVLPGVLDSVSDAFQNGYTYGKKFVTEVGGSKAFSNFSKVAQNVAGGVADLATGFRDGEGAGGALKTALVGIVTTFGAVVTVGSGVLAFLSSHKTLVLALVGTFVTLRATVIAFNVAQAATKAGGLAIYIGELLAKIPLVAAVTKTYAAVQWLLNAAMTANPIGLIVVGIAALIGVIVLIATKTTWFQTIWGAVWGGIKTAAQAVGSWFAGPFAGFFTKAWNTLKSGVSTAVDFVKAHWKLLVGIVGGPLAALVVLVATHWTQIKSTTSKVWNAIKTAISAVWTAIKAVVNGGISAVKTYFNGLSAVVNIAKSAFDRVRSAIADKLNAAVTLVRGLPGRVTGALGDLGGLLVGAGHQIIQGLLDGLDDMIGKVESKLRALTNKLPDWKGPAKKDKKILRPNGRLIMQGLLKGIEDGTSSVKKVLQDLTKALPKNKIKTTLKAVKDEYASGLDVAKAITAISAKIETAKQGLTDAVGLRDDFLKSVRDSARDWAGAASFQSDDDTPITASAVVQQMKDRLAAIVTFRANLQTLLSQGLDDQTYQDLANAGVEAGGALAAALVQDPASVTAIAQLSKQIGTAADGLGTDTSAHLYQAGVDGAQKYLDGLQVDKTKLQTKADGIAAQIAKALKDALNLALSVDDLLPGDQGSYTNGDGNKGDGKGKGKGKKKPSGSGAFGVKVYDSGGILEPGTLAFNASRKPEAVFNQKQFAQYAAAARTGDGDEPKKVFIYNAAEGSSIGSEEDLFAAVSRARMTGF